MENLPDNFTPSYVLRPYQQESVNRIVAHVKTHLSTCLVELATGAGKSLICADLALFFVKVAPTKKVLCLAPTTELVLQNAAKYALTGDTASVYCSSAGKKCLRNQVVFASPGSAIGVIEKLAHMGVSAIILDEAHRITASIKKIIEAVLDYEIRGVKINEKCRIIGMTATPYRMKTGYIYAIDSSGDNEVHLDETKAIDPFFSRLLHRVPAGYLVDEGFLTSPVIGQSLESGYDTTNLVTDSFGRFTSKSIKAAFEGETKTERIVNAIIKSSVHRRGVMIFASTISHAEEIMGYLPGNDSRFISGKLGKKDREEAINGFVEQKYKYIVNVDILTTGFDAPHADFCCIMRATESASLFQQIIGRVLRLFEGKTDALIWDFAQNVERHKLQADIFTPEIKAKAISGDGVEISVTCPACCCISDKKRRSDDIYAGLAHDVNGYFLISGTESPTVYNSDNEPIEWEGVPMTMKILDPSTIDDFGECEYKDIPIPAHYSRRCSNPEAYIMSGKPIACTHRYSMKICPECNGENDIAARQCIECKARLVDPNEKLTEGAGLAGMISTGETKVVSCASATFKSHKSKSGNVSLKVTYNTSIGSIDAYHTTRQHWVFNRLAFANNSSPTAIDKAYSVCDSWTVAPDSVKVKKTLNSSGYANYEIKEVIYGSKIVTDVT